MSDPRKEYKEVIRSMRDWPLAPPANYPEDHRTCLKFLKGTKAMIENKDLLALFEELFLTHPMSPMFRMVIIGMTRDFDSRLRACEA